jgi:hypothetical protein
VLDPVDGRVGPVPLHHGEHLGVGEVARWLVHRRSIAPAGRTGALAAEVSTTLARCAHSLLDHRPPTLVEQPRAPASGVVETSEPTPGLVRVTHH